MHLEPGFVVGGRFRILRLLGGSLRFRIYSAEARVPGLDRVAIKVLRHGSEECVRSVLEARERLRTEARMLSRLHEAGVSAVPLTLSLVEMYPGDEARRLLVRPHLHEVAREPYLVRSWVHGQGLARLLRSGDLDEGRAWRILLRLLLLLRQVEGAGMILERVRPEAFVLDALGENISLVDGSDLVDAVTCSRPPLLPNGLAAVAIGLLCGQPAPDWEGSEEQATRWKALLLKRGVDRDAREFVLTAFGLLGEAPWSLAKLEDWVRRKSRLPSLPWTTLEGPSGDGWPPYEGTWLAERFRILSPWSQGARGQLYLAEDRDMGYSVLVKTNRYVYDSGREFAQDLAQRRAELAHESAMLQRFAQWTGMLPQPVALVEAKGRGPWFEMAPHLSHDEPFLVMEWLRAMPLLDAVDGLAQQGESHMTRFVLRLVIELAHVLQRVHDEGYFLQDLKPDNLLYDPRTESLYMVDLAAVCPLSPEGGPDRTAVAFGAQTNGYAAPEFGDDWRSVDGRFDLYSLGATAWHLLSGLSPSEEAHRQGTEYPRLSLEPLKPYGPAVQKLVASLLSPVSQRPPNARTVAREAERLLLAQSDDRLLDVQQLRVVYTATGPWVHWAAPPDPRVVDVEVSWGEGQSRKASVAAGAMALPSGLRLPLEILVRTCAWGGPTRMRSRGKTLWVEARPAPHHVRADAEPGRVRLRWGLPGHATGVRIRVSAESTPLLPGDGQAVRIRGEREAVYRTSTLRPLHFALFAAYEEGLSAPASVEATPGGSPPHPGRLSLAQHADGWRLCWEHPSWPSQIVLRQKGGAGRHLLEAGRGRTDVRLPALPPQTSWQATWAPVLPNGEPAEVRARVGFRTPPLPPQLRAEVGPGKVRLGIGPLWERTGDVSVYAKSTRTAGEELRPTAVVRGKGGAYASIPLSDIAGKVSVRLSCALDGTWPSENATLLHVPPVQPRASLERVAEEKPQVQWPPALAITLPGDAERWPGDHRWMLVHETNSVRREVGSLWKAPCLGSRESAEWVDLGAPAGSSGEWTLLWRPPWGEWTEVASCPHTPLHWTPPPLELEPRLDGVQARLPQDMAPWPDGVDRGPWEVECVQDGRVTRVSNVEFPFDLDVPGGESAVVRWRWMGGAVTMPWSPSRQARALKVPAPPVQVRATEHAQGVWLQWAWEEDPPPRARVWRIRAGSKEELLYEGEAPGVLDAEPGSPDQVWRVEGHRQGLVSPSVDVAPTSNLARPADPRVPQGPLALSDAVPILVLGAWWVLAGRACGGPTQWGLTHGDAPTEHTPIQRTVRTTPLVPLAREHEDVLSRTVWKRSWPAGEWRALGSVRRVPLQWIVGLSIEGDLSIRLTWLAGAGPGSSRCWLVGWSGRSIVGKIAMTSLLARWDAAGHALRPLVRIGAAMARASGWTLQDEAGALEGTVVIPLAREVDASAWLDRLHWDVIVGWQHGVLYSVVAHLSAAVVSERFGWQSIVHGLYRGRPFTAKLLCQATGEETWWLEFASHSGHHRISLGPRPWVDTSARATWRLAVQELVHHLHRGEEGGAKELFRD